MGVLTRVLRSVSGDEVLDRLAALPGSDLNRKERLLISGVGVDRFATL